MKGDRVEIVIDSGEGTQTYEVTATRAGRRVEITNRRGVVEVSEVTRTGTAVRTARFMASRVVALVEHPADTSGAGLAAGLACPDGPSPSGGSALPWGIAAPRSRNCRDGPSRLRARRPSCGWARTRPRRQVSTGRARRWMR